MPSITVLAFGAVTDILGRNRFELNGISTTEELKQSLEAEFPALKNIQYAIAVNKQIATVPTGLGEGATVALLPPFGGG
jgi:sulfur-carrier protein